MKPMVRITSCLLTTGIPGLHPKAAASATPGEGPGIIFLPRVPGGVFIREAVALKVWSPGHSITGNVLEMQILGSSPH